MNTEELSRNQIRPMLEKGRGRLSMHMPGHKGMGADIPMWADTTELPETDDLFAPHAGIRRAEEMAALTYKAGHTILLSGGSTTGILAMMLYAAKPGDTVILPRNCHHSVISAVILGGFKPVFIPCQMSEEGYAYTLNSDVIDTVEENPGAALVLLTRPDYYGICMDLSGVVFATHARGMRLLIDEAHGAHFPALRGIKSAAEWEADIWVNSAHKTLPALTGAAYLHMRAGEDVRRMRQILRMVHSSSPSFPILCSLEDARAYMIRQGTEKLMALSELCERTRMSFERAGFHSPQQLWAELQGGSFDPTRLIIDVGNKRLSGFEAQEQLSEMGADVEMADHRHIVAITTIMDRVQDIRSFVQCVMNLKRGSADLPYIPPADYGEYAMNPRDAVFARSEVVDVQDAEGRVSCASIGAYPPGIPQVVPGERLTKGIIEQLFKNRASSHIFGLEGSGIRVVVEE